MELRLINEQGLEASRMVASDALFSREYNEALIHQVVVAYQANARSGNRAQKDREQVRHTTAKPFRQKGTGRARAGMSSSPLWRGGGRIFPNSPDENFSQKLNKKMYRAGMASIMSQLVREERLAVIESITVAAPDRGISAGAVASASGTGAARGIQRSGRHCPGPTRRSHAKFCETSRLARRTTCVGQR